MRPKRAHSISAKQEDSGKRRPRVAIALAVLALFFFASTFGQEWLGSRQIAHNVSRLRQETAQANALNAQLTQQLAYYSSKQYIVSQARALGMARPGDTVLMINQLGPTVKIVHDKPTVKVSDGILDRILRSIL